MPSRIQTPGDPVREPERKRGFIKPDITFAPESLGPGCSLKNDCRRLLNHTMEKPDPPPSNPYNFAGARATLSLSAGDVVYWEVVWKIPKLCQYKPGVQRLLVMGMATEEALRAAAEDDLLGNVNRTDIAVLFHVDAEDDETTRATGALEQLYSEALAAEPNPTEFTDENIMVKQAAKLNPSKPNGARIGFLFNGPKSTVLGCKVPDYENWWTTKVDVSKPLYPFACVQSEEKVGKVVWLEFKPGPGFGMTPKKIQVLENMIKGDAGRHETFSVMSWHLHT